MKGWNTANFAVYRIVNNEVVFDLLGREGNPFVDERFQAEAYAGILGNDFFSPQGAMKEHILAAIQPDATVRYSDLRLQTKGCDSRYCYVEVDVENNTVGEKSLFKQVYGTENPGRGKVYLLREEVVREQVQENEDDMVARACYFGNLQDFGAYDWGIDGDDSAVRGVRRAKRAEVAVDVLNVDYLVTVQLPHSVYAAMKAGKPFTFEGKEYSVKEK